MKKILLPALGAVIALSAAEPLPQEKKPAVLRFDLSSTGLEKMKNGNRLWHIPADRESSKIVFDLDKLGVTPNDYDEIRVLFCNRKGVAGLAARLTNYPATDQLRNWYSKTALPENQFIDQRFDLRMDDDGWWFGNPVMDGHKLELTLLKKYKRVPGEPPGREVEIAAVELIRRKADLTFDETAAVLSADPKSISWKYHLEILNREAVPQKLELSLDTGGLKHFKADWTKKTLSLGPREKVNLPLVLSIPRSEAEKLPPLYSERVLPKLIFKDDPPIFPLIGYRPRYVWATLPVENVRVSLAVPKTDRERKELTAKAEAAAAKTFAVPPQVHPEYCAIFKPREMEALSFYRVRDRKTGEDISKKPGVTGSYIYHHNEQTFRDLKLMAQAYKLTGNPAYAEKIRDILLEYAHWFRYLPPRGPSSTGGGSRLTSTTLDLCYFFTDGVEAYVAVKDSPVFGKADREKIESSFLAPLMKNLYSHDIEFTNMQLHHIANYGSAAILLNRYWNLLGDALYGDHGFYAFVRDGFTADGIALEGGAYHPFGLLPLLDFAAKIRECGIELVNDPFKRIFDHGILCTPQGIADGNLRSTYPLAWERFRDPKYLPTLKLMKKLPPGIQAKDVPDTLFLGNTLQKNNGYLWIREDGPYGFRAIAINYIMGWDRLEHDRLNFRLFDHGMLSHEVSRVGYTNPGADMEATVSHNTIVVDEKNSAPNPSALAAFLDRKGLPGALFTENPQSPLYPDIAFSRVIALFDGILFVGDRQYAKDGKVHTFDWPFYAPWQPWAKEGEWEFSLPGDFQTPFKTSYRHVASAVSSPVKDGLKASVDIPPSTLEKGFDVRQKSDRRLSMTFALPRETTAAKFRIGRGHNPKPGPMLLLRQQGKDAEFAAAFDTVKTGGKERIESVRSLPFEPADPLSAVWEVKADSGTYYVIVNRTGKELKAGNIRTNQQFEVIKK
ncbi:MAG: hypothetical protein BWY31_00230 [Lentisphaerae bacterium ADurb.Bin242]|nr:MAG: hypothetical protein BWY31_00230 [Lentisphaerae bacterium ADurb.Bin242]